MRPQAQQPKISPISFITTIVFGLIMWGLAVLLVIEGFGIIDDLLGALFLLLIGAAAIGYCIAEALPSKTQLN